MAEAGATAEDLTQLAKPEVITFKAQEAVAPDRMAQKEAGVVEVLHMEMPATEVLEQIP